jgi:hypothetical protein
MIHSIFRYKLLFIAFFFVFKDNSVLAQSDWKLSTNKEGIKIYTSIVPNSKVKAVKVECSFKATTSQLVAVLLDVKACPEWVYHTKSCTLVKQVSPSELYYYSEVSLPWPAENRDFVAHLTVTQNPETKVVIVDGPAVEGFVPVKEDIVRVDHSKGKWIITPLGKDQIKVEYSLHVDPGGALPVWLVNMFATDGPMQIFRNLKLQLQKPAYKNIKLSFIEN